MQQIKFFMNEILPILEQEISEKLHHPYSIRPWISGPSDNRYALLQYIALPKEFADGIRIYFTNNGNEYIYAIENNKKAHIYLAQKNDKKHFIEDDIKIQKLIEEGSAFPIFEKTICKENLLLCLISDSIENSLLQIKQKNNEKISLSFVSTLTKNLYSQKQKYGESAFIYPEELSFLDDTIEDFAKKKIKTKF